MDGVKEVEGEILGVHVDEVTGMPHAQIQYHDGIITERGNVLQGKPKVAVDNVDISNIEKVTPKPVLPESPTLPGPEKRTLSRSAEKPSGESINPDSYSGKIFRQAADKEAAEILLKEYRVGEKAHIEQLSKQINDDHWVRVEATSRDRNTNYVSQIGKVEDPRFDPKIYYAHQAEEFYSASTNAQKVSRGGVQLSQAESNFKGTYRYDANGNATRANSARDIAERQVRKAGTKAGKTAEEIDSDVQKLRTWMNKYDDTVARNGGLERAKAAQKEFEVLKPKLEEAINQSASLPLPQSQFESMAKQFKDMLLEPEKKEAAEAALRRIRCSRPEWSVGDTYAGFNLKCN